MAKKNKTTDDEEFEKLVREFIETELDFDDTPDDNQVDFTLDEAMNATCGQPKACQRGGVEEVLVCCLQDKDDYWERIASRPGMAQFRRKIMETRQLVLYNEFRKENDLDEMGSCKNLLICTRNDDINKYVQKDEAEFLPDVTLPSSKEHIYSFRNISALFEPGRESVLRRILAHCPSMTLCVTHFV